MTTKLQYAPTYRPKNQVRASRSTFSTSTHASSSGGHDAIPGRSPKMEGPPIELVRDITVSSFFFNVVINRLITSIFLYCYLL